MCAAISAGRAARGDGVQHVVVDEPAHLLPAALLGQRVAAPAAGRPSRGPRAPAGRRASSRRTPSSRRACGVVVADRHDDLGDRRRSRRGVASRSGQAFAHRRHRHLVQEPLGPERHDEQAVGDLGGGTGQPRAQRTDVDRRRPVRVGTRAEGRRHQRVAVELAVEVEPLAGRPRPRRSPAAPPISSVILATGLSKSAPNRFSICVRICVPEAEREPALG